MLIPCIPEAGDRTGETLWLSGALADDRQSFMNTSVSMRVSSFVGGGAGDENSWR